MATVGIIVMAAMMGAMCLFGHKTGRKQPVRQRGGAPLRFGKTGRLIVRKLTRFIPALSVLSLALFPGAVFAGGACCSVAGADSSRLNLALVGASAWNHEIIGADTYELLQQALILKLGKPVWRGFVLQAQIGLPTATRLSHQAMRISGEGGLIYGAGFGYKLPQFPGPVNFFASASYSHALAYLNRDDTGAIDRTFHINEFQAVFIGEAALTSKTALYSGLRAYSGKNQLNDGDTGIKLNGDQEGSLAGLAGIRHSLSDKISLTADGGFGHIKVIGIGAVFSF